MLDEFNGLPTHVLLVHAVIVLIPLAALLTVLSALWPAARRRLGIITPLVGLVALISTQLASSAGEWLQARVADSPLITDHVDLGTMMIWYGIGLFVASVLVWAVPLLLSRGARGAPAPWVGVVLAVVAIVVSGAAVLQVVRVGEAGSRAVWSGSFCEVPRVDGACPATG